MVFSPFFPQLSWVLYFWGDVEVLCVWVPTCASFSLLLLSIGCVVS